MNEIEPTINNNSPGYDLFERVTKWNIKRGNTNFNHYLETKMLAEELFEFCGYSRAEAKNYAREFADTHSSKTQTTDRSGNIVLIFGDGEVVTISKSDLADAAGDLQFVSIGTVYKLEFNPHRVLKTICNHNDAKGSIKDADGKILKDSSFVEPVHE